MKKLVGVAALVLLAGVGPGVLAAQGGERSLERLVADYIGLYRKDVLDEWRTLFLPSFTVTHPNADGSISTRTLDEFVEGQRRGFAESREIKEVLENVQVERRGRIASVWADFIYTRDGVARRGKLVLLCVDDRGDWKLQSLLFSYLP